MDYKKLIEEKLKNQRRSEAFKRGMLEELRYQFDGVPQNSPPAGTSDADAYWAGSEKGLALYDEIKPPY